MIRKLGQFFFFGNYFLGFCIAMLSLETLVQNGFYSFNLLYFIEVFLLTKVYYTHAYNSEIKFYKGTNVRTQWYVRHRNFIRTAQRVYTVAAIIILFYFAVHYFNSLIYLSFSNCWLAVLLFPLLASLYYGILFLPRHKFNLRSYGRLKPFIIGFVATGAVTVYPLVFFSMEHKQTFHFTTPLIFYFIANLMFTTVIAIMFDIKDYASDHNHRLKTLVVRFGLRNSVYYVLLPFILTGMIALVFFAIHSHYSFFQIALNCLPFALLAAVAWSLLQQRKKILYYLAVIDGLLLVKAICGITAVLLFNGKP